MSKIPLGIVVCKSFWGQEDKIKDLKKGVAVDFDCEELDQTGRRLHVLHQYLYLQERVDKLRNMQDTLGPRECVVGIGTPGIGKRSSP